MRARPDVALLETVAFTGSSPWATRMDLQAVEMLGPQLLPVVS